MSEPNYFVYMLQCDNGSYYTGYTTDIARRYQEHLDGTMKCKYTRSFKPVKIAQSWTTDNNKSEALKIERYIKKLSKHGKNELVLYPAKLTTIFQCSLAKLPPEIKNTIRHRDMALKQPNQVVNL